MKLTDITNPRRMQGAAYMLSDLGSYMTGAHLAAEEVPA